MSSLKSKLHKEPKSRRRPKSKAQDLDRSWSMYPALHDSVGRLLEEDDLSFTFFAIDEDKGSIEKYDTNIMGRFKCLNEVCPQTGWASKMIAITIRMYPEQQYNARVYHQRCKSCGSLSQPFPDDSYAKRIAYRLKKWSGIEMDQPFYTMTWVEIRYWDRKGRAQGMEAFLTHFFGCYSCELIWIFIQRETSKSERAEVLIEGYQLQNHRSHWLRRCEWAREYWRVDGGVGCKIGRFAKEVADLVVAVVVSSPLVFEGRVAVYASFPLSYPCSAAQCESI
ncbi:hypothetical protein G7Y89_g2079 [Cudoniella acicularis]|uniref:3CxxC-type domain-containing protein n=1 Tax=Cudoniella acicularis TaxID=354080 RepID=A0A8H4RVZ9_9HELO|nr:hypothetical protein G7Y89_g2079 [Cudoniella acicularis]